MIKNQNELDELIVKPTDNYHGKSYSELVQEFVQWLLQDEPDNQTLRDVVFLRGVDTSPYSSYSHRFVRIGKDALQMNEGQALMFTQTTVFLDSVHHHLETPEKRTDYVNQLLEEADNPPSKNKVSFDGFNPDIDWSEYKVITPNFTVIVPEPSNRNLGQYLDFPFNIPGPTECVCGGYFLLLKNLPPGNHIVGFHGLGDFGYRNQALVELNVVPKDTVIQKPSMFPGDMQALKSIVDSKIESGEISNGKDFYQVLRSLEPTDDIMNEIQERTKEQINKINVLTREQKAIIDKSERIQEFNKLNEVSKIKKTIDELKLQISEEEFQQILDLYKYK
jgi:hypothetical protein